MLHQAKVLLVGKNDIASVVCEFDGNPIGRGVDGDACIKWIPPHVDDASVWQRQVDGSQKLVVRGHFVRYMRNSRRDGL